MSRRTFLWVVVLIPAMCAYIACGDEAGVSRTVDVSTLTFEDVQQSALDAATRPGQVLHVSSETNSGASEAWIDIDRDLARVQYDDHVQVYYERRSALASPTERFRDAPFDSPLLKTSIYGVEYLRHLFADTALNREIREGAVDGKPAIVAEIKQDVYDYDATETFKIYLNESFLPLRIDHDSERFGRGTSNIAYTFVDAASLPSDFFSPEPLRALARTPLDDLADANASGLDIYWLGEQFEDMILEEASVSIEAFDGEPSANYSYAPADFFIVAPCVHIAAYSDEAWKVLGTRRAQNSSADARGIAYDEFPIDGGNVTVYRGVVVPPQGPVVIQPADGSTLPTPPPLPVVPADTGTARMAVVTLDSGTVLEVDASCAPVGSNIYRTDEAFLRLVRAMRQFRPST